MTLSPSYINRLCYAAIERALFPPRREPRSDKASIRVARAAMTQRLKDELEQESAFSKAVRLGAWDGMHKPKVAG